MRILRRMTTVCQLSSSMRSLARCITSWVSSAASNWFRPRSSSHKESFASPIYKLMKFLRKITFKKKMWPRQPLKTSKPVSKAAVDPRSSSRYCQRVEVTIERQMFCNKPTSTREKKEWTTEYSNSRESFFQIHQIRRGATSRAWVSISLSRRRNSLESATRTSYPPPTRAELTARTLHSTAAWRRRWEAAGKAANSHSPRWSRATVAWSQWSWFSPCPPGTTGRSLWRVAAIINNARTDNQYRPKKSSRVAQAD